MKYSVPTFEIEELDTEDVILTSSPTGGMGGPNETGRVSLEYDDPYAGVLGLR